MYKHFLENVLMAQKKYLLFMSMLMCISLHGMDNDILFKEVIIPQLNCTQRTDHLRVYYYDQEMLRQFAMVNTVLNKEIENHYRPAKKRIEQWIQENKISVIPAHISWNKYFTKCAWIKTRPSFLRKKLELTSLCAVGREITMRKKVWDNYIGLAMEDMDRPVFSRGGYMVYIYGYGYTFFDPFHGERRVIEYSLWFTGTAKNKSCFFRFYNQRTMYCFSHLLNFPLLMKAFFKSTDKHEYIDEGELLRVYALSGVTIPDNYTVYKTCSLANYGNYGSYDELGYGIKKTLDMRYKEQQREQKKT